MSNTDRKSVSYIVNRLVPQIGIIGVICYFLSGDDNLEMTDTFVTALA